MNYSKFTTKSNNRVALFQFYESAKLPRKYPITTPFTFPFIGEDVVLTFDKGDFWNPLGGHMEVNENYKDTLVRESQEEAGIKIIKSSVKVVGYILNTNRDNSSNSKYPPYGILPITLSFVDKVNKKWQPIETQLRGVFRRKAALELMKIRTDNNQMLEILNYVYKIFDKQKYQTSFTYFPDKIFSNIPVTQAFTFCKDKNNSFCVVRDSDEKFFSLPGGSCELNESSDECVERELAEEAQLSCNNKKLLGSILVEMKRDGKVVSKFQHLRFIADVNSLDKFIPQKHGFETVERKFIPLSELKSNIMILQNPNGEKLLKQVQGIL